MPRYVSLLARDGIRNGKKGGSQGRDIPILTIRCTTRHGAQQVLVDFNHLFHRPTRDITARRRARIDADDDAAAEPERERRRAVRELDLGLRVLRHGIGVRGEERCRLTGGNPHEQNGDWGQKARRRTSGTRGICIPLTTPNSLRLPHAAAASSPCPASSGLTCTGGGARRCTRDSMVSVVRRGVCVTLRSARTLSCAHPGRGDHSRHASADDEDSARVGEACSEGWAGLDPRGQSDALHAVIMTSDRWAQPARYMYLLPVSCRSPRRTVRQHTAPPCPTCRPFPRLRPADTSARDTATTIPSRPCKSTAMRKRRGTERQTSMRG